MRYELYLLGRIQGRGEFVRLALEEGRTPRAGLPALTRLLEAARTVRLPFALPALKAGNETIAQTANILLFLGSRLGLAPARGVPCIRAPRAVQYARHFRHYPELDHS